MDSSWKEVPAFFWILFTLFESRLQVHKYGHISCARCCCYLWIGQVNWHGTAKTNFEIWKALESSTFRDFSVQWPRMRQGIWISTQISSCRSCCPHILERWIYYKSHGLSNPGFSMCRQPWGMSWCRRSSLKLWFAFWNANGEQHGDNFANNGVGTATMIWCVCVCIGGGGVFRMMEPIQSQVCKQVQVYWKVLCFSWQTLPDTW